MTGQRQLRSSMTLQEPSAGSPSTEAFPWGLSWGISLSLWPSPVWRGWHNPKVARQDMSISVAISTWWGWPGPKAAWQDTSITVATSVLRDEAWPWGGPEEPTDLLSLCTIPSKAPGHSCGAEFWGTFTRTRRSWGRGCHPKEKGFSCSAICAWCPIASHPPR